MSTDDDSTEDSADSLDLSDEPGAEVESLLTHLVDELEALDEHMRRLRDRIDGGASRANLREHLETIRTSARETRTSLERALHRATDVSAEPEADLAEALESLYASDRDEGGKEVEWTLERAESLPRRLRPALYHIARETLSTLLGSDETDRASVVLKVREDVAELVVVEQTPESELGMTGVPDHDWRALRDRVRQLGGEVTVETSWRSGTELKVEIPLSSTTGSGAPLESDETS